MASKRRGNGEGTIRLRKNGGYEARLTLDNGARKSIYGHRYEEVRRKLAAAVRDRDDGALMLGDARQTVGKSLLIGYARVSTFEQTLDLQQDALRTSGVTKLFTDTASWRQSGPCWLRASHPVSASW
jgi:hypothetical protein